MSWKLAVLPVDGNINKYHGKENVAAKGRVIFPLSCVFDYF